MAHIILILGGVRSGKSRFAQQLAAKLGGDDVLFIATAEPGDHEMRQRIRQHQQDRPAAWNTVEEPRQVSRAIAGHQESSKVVVIDCLTLLVSNLLLDSAEPGESLAAVDRVETETITLLDVCHERDGTVIIVSGEVGMGIVPDSELGRQFRDLLGRANQHIAQRATAVYLMCAGLPIDVRAFATSVDQAAEHLST